MKKKSSKEKFDLNPNLTVSSTNHMSTTNYIKTEQRKIISISTDFQKPSENRKTNRHPQQAQHTRRQRKVNIVHTGKKKQI